MIQRFDPLYIVYNVDSNGNKISIPVTNERQVVVNGQFTLVQIPDKNNHVVFPNDNTMYEININQQITTNKQYKVDYDHGIVYVHSDLEADVVYVNYSARGVVKYPATRIYDTSENVPIDTAKSLQDYIDRIKELQFEEFDATKVYNINKIVSYNNSTYICIQETINHETPINGSYWKVFAAGFKYRGTYSNGTLYATRDVVWYDTEKIMCVCIQSSQGHLPTDTNYWQVMFSLKAELDYAKEQGDYAKTEGDYAKLEGDYTKTERENITTEYAIIKDDYLNATYTETWRVDFGTYTATADNTTYFDLELGIFNHLIDILELSYEGVPLIENKHYTLTGLTVTLLDWSLKTGETIDIRIEKGSRDTIPAGTDGTAIMQNTIGEEKLTTDVQIKLNKNTIIERHVFTAITDSTTGFTIASDIFNPTNDDLELTYKGEILEKDENYSLVGYDVTLGFAIDTGETIKYKITKSIGFMIPTLPDGSLIQNGTIPLQKLTLDVQNKIKQIGYASAEYFGIVGDGINDDTQAIKNADDYSVMNGVTIVYPRKTFKVGSSINIRGQHDFSQATVKVNSDFHVFNIFPSGLIKNIKVDVSGLPTFTSKVFSLSTNTSEGNAWVSNTVYAANTYVTANSKVYKCKIAGTSSSTSPSHTNGDAVDGTTVWTYVGAKQNVQAWLNESTKCFDKIKGALIISGDNAGIGIGFYSSKPVGGSGGYYISGVNISDVMIYGAIGKGISFYTEDLSSEVGEYLGSWIDHNCISNIQLYNNKTPISRTGACNNNQMINVIVQNDTAQTAANLPDLFIGKLWDRAQASIPNLDDKYGGTYMLGGISPAYIKDADDNIKMSSVISGMINRLGLYTWLCGFQTNDLEYNKGNLLKGTYSIIDEFDGNALNNRWRVQGYNNTTPVILPAARLRTNGRHLKGFKLRPLSTSLGDFCQVDFGDNCMLTKDLNINALITFSIDWVQHTKWRVGFYKDESNYILLEKDEQNFVNNNVYFKCKSNGVETVKTLAFGWNYSYTFYKAVFEITPTSASIKLAKEWQGSPYQLSSTNLWTTSTNTQGLIFETITTNIPSGFIQPYFYCEVNQAGQTSELFIHSLEVHANRLKSQ